MPGPLKLYGPPLTPFTEKCRRALVYKDLDHQIVEPNGPEDYRRWSPRTGLLPVLQIDDEWVEDSTAILLRLEQLKPAPALLAEDPMIADQQRMLENWADEAIGWYWSRWVPLRSHIERERTRAGASSPWRRFRAWLKAGGTWERPLTGLVRGIDDRMGDLVNFLGSRRFFYSDRISIADLAVHSLLFTLQLDAIPGTRRLLASRPTLLEYKRRVEEETGGPGPAPPDAA